jgi:transposase-like protein
LRLLKRLTEEIRWRTYVVRIFPNVASCCRLVRALAVKTHENWLKAHRYLNMDDLREHKKDQRAKPLSQPDQPTRFAELDAHNRSGCSG